MKFERASTTVLEDAKKLKCSLKGKSIYLERSYRGQWLQITFQRTVRVPDNKEISELPPNLGKFPLYPTSKFAHNMPPEMAAKGGVFFPMHEREAMWMRFESSGPFAIKVYAGGVNVVSGEPMVQNMATSLHRLGRYREGKSIGQDYMIVPEQLWLDGIATEEGRVRQFVSVPTESGYSVETQITGQNDIGGIQFEVTPQQTVVPKMLSRNTDCPIFVATLTGKMIPLVIRGTQTVERLKEQIQDKEGIPPDQQRLIYQGRMLSDYEHIEDHAVSEGSVLHLVLRLRGGGEAPPPKKESTEMSIAAGGRINQSICADNRGSGYWDVDSTVLFNVQIVNTEEVKHITTADSSKPGAPMSMQECAAKGIPFFKFGFPETASSVSGDFGEVKSVMQLDKIKGGKASHRCTEEKSHKVPIVLIDCKGKSLAYEPVSGGKTRVGTGDYVKF